MKLLNLKWQPQSWPKLTDSPRTSVIDTCHMARMMVILVFWRCMRQLWQHKDAELSVFAPASAEFLVSPGGNFSPRGSHV